jgi:hypothetical protein
VCCMALTPSEVYRCSAELRQLCNEEGLDAEGPVRALRDKSGAPFEGQSYGE